MRAYRGIPCYYIGSPVHEFCDWRHVIYGLPLGVPLSFTPSLCPLALPVAAVLTAVIHWERLCTVALDQNVSQKDSRLLLLLLYLLHGAESFGRS